MAVAAGDEAGLAVKFAVMRRLLDERQWRVYLGTEAVALGYGGIAAVARASGASPVTVAAGVAEAGDEVGLGVLGPGRSRHPGAGRPRAEDAQPGLRQALLEVVEAATRGDPVAEITWCSLSLPEIARRLAARGYACGKDAAARMLHEEGYSLRAMAKVLEGKQHPDRDAQFGHISVLIGEFKAAGEPVISVDAKKKEQLGPFRRDGRSWRPRGEPVKVRDHSFPDKELGKIIPYGIYDIAANRGFVSVGTSGNTAALAVSTMRRWWQREGSVRYPDAARLLVTCDAGSPNSCRGRLWKDELAALAAQTGLEITVCHFPPGTSKWNKIEHRLFCHITRTWRARPLMTREDAVAGIAATTTYAGLKVTAVLDDADYPTGTGVSDQRMRYLEDRILDRDPVHGDWNYTVLPAPRPGPDPGPREPDPGPGRAPDPALLTALAALAGVPSLPALAAGIRLPWQADREHRRALARGRTTRIKDSGAAPWRLPYEAIITAAACRIRLNMTFRLLSEILGPHPSTISEAVARATPLLEHHGITRPPGTTPLIKTLDEIRSHATARNITLPPIPPAP
jgi:hypothetical protein